MNNLLILGPCFDIPENGDDVIPEEINLCHNALLKWLVQVSLQCCDKSALIFYEHSAKKSFSFHPLVQEFNTC